MGAVSAVLIFESSEDALRYGGMLEDGERAGKLVFSFFLSYIFPLCVESSVDALSTANARLRPDPNRTRFSLV